MTLERAKKRPAGDCKMSGRRVESKRLPRVLQPRSLHSRAASYFHSSWITSFKRAGRPDLGHECVPASSLFSSSGRHRPDTSPDARASLGLRRILRSPPPSPMFLRGPHSERRRRNKFSIAVLQSSTKISPMILEGQ
jgi:hypothetical protein